MRVLYPIRPHRRRIAAAVVALTGLAGGLVLGATPAGAVPPAISIATSDAGALEVHGLDQSALWVQATVHDAESTVLAQTDDLTWNGPGQWQTADALHLPDGTAYGDYSVDVDYRLPADSAVQHVADAGTFSYRRHLSVSAVSADRSYTDLDHPTVTFSGAVNVLDPAAGTTAPAAAGSVVRLQWTSYVGGAIRQGNTTAVTAADGTFSAAVTPGGPLASGTVRADAPADGTATADAAAALPAVNTRSVQVRVVAAPVHVRVHAGQSFRLSGTVQRFTANGWQPYSGAALVTTTGEPDYFNYSTPGLIGSGHSDASGHFTYWIRASRTQDAYTYVHLSSYVQENIYATSHIMVPRAGTYSNLGFSIDAYHGVKLAGRLHGACLNESVRLQYSRNGRTGWASVGSAARVQYVGTAACSFVLKVNGPDDGYFRVTHSESDYMLAVTSYARRLHRTPTRLGSLAISPTRPYPNHRMTFRGGVTQKSGTRWTAFKHARVVLAYKPKGDRNWYWVVKGWTNSTGHYSLTSKAWGDGYWAVYYEPDRTHFYSETKARWINVR